MEDTGATFDELCQQFGEEVAMIVAEVTNNQTLIDKWGKEQYMNFELTSLSDEALFVKLCDNYYNIVDYPKDTQKKRIINNIKYLIRHKKLNSRCKELCT
jgi:(p)ppGpp synthase/HD superfamily hydrolase